MKARIEQIRKGAMLVMTGDTILGYFFWFERDAAISYCDSFNAGSL